MWSDRNVRRVVAARFISRVGGEAAFFVGIWGKTAFVLDASAAGIALVMGSLGVASLVGSALSGVLVDRFDPRRVLMVGELAFVPAALGMVFANTIPQLAIAGAILGFFGTPVFTAIGAFGPYLAQSEDELAKVNGYIEGASWGAFVVGPGLGAVVAATMSIDTIFVVDAITSAIAALLVVPVTVRELDKSDSRGGHGLAELRDGFRFAYAHKRLRFYVLLGSALWILFGMFTTLEPLFFRDVLGTEVEAMGWMASIFGAGLIAGTALAGKMPARFRNARVLTLVVSLNALGVVAYVGTNQIRVVIAASVFWGLLIGLMAPLHRTLIQINSPDELIGRITGVTQIHAEVGHLLPLAVAPGVAAVLGVQGALLASAGIVVLVAALFWPTAVKLDKTRDVAVPETGLGDPELEPWNVGS